MSVQFKAQDSQDGYFLCFQLHNYICKVILFCFSKIVEKLKYVIPHFYVDNFLHFDKFNFNIIDKFVSLQYKFNFNNH